MKGKFTIESNVTEREVVESYLNYYYSGRDATIFLVIHAMAHSWKYNKLIYYKDLVHNSDGRGKK